MQILITPSDIVKRCLWTNYKKFVLYDKKEEEIKNILEEDKPTVISEQDAYVIGLIKVIETDNLVHRFNQHINELLQINSMLSDDILYIRKNIILKELSIYKNRFPKYCKLTPNYERSLEELDQYLVKFKDIVDGLEVTMIKKQEKEFEYVKSKKLKKHLDINN